MVMSEQQLSQRSCFPLFFLFSLFVLPLRQEDRRLLGGGQDLAAHRRKGTDTALPCTALPCPIHVTALHCTGHVTGRLDVSSYLSLHCPARDNPKNIPHSVHLTPSLPHLSLSLCLSLSIFPPLPPSLPLPLSPSFPLPLLKQTNRCSSTRCSPSTKRTSPTASSRPSRPSWTTQPSRPQVRRTTHPVCHTSCAVRHTPRLTAMLYDASGVVRRCVRIL